MKKIIIHFLIFCFSAHLAHASFQSPCSFNAFHFKGLTLQTGQFKDKTCFVTIAPRNQIDLIYRSYLITSKGQIMVFNSFGDGPINTDTGARVFHLFPYKGNLSYNINGGDNIDVQLTSGNTLTFSKSQGIPTSITNGYITIDPKISPYNQGGVSIESSTDLIVDSGFELGGTPIANSKGESIITDKNGETCLVMNDKIFDQKDGEVYLIPNSNPKLKRLLANYCKVLNF